MAEKMINSYEITQSDNIDKFKVTENDLKVKGLQSGGAKPEMIGTAEQNRKKFDLFPAFVAQQLDGLIDFLKSPYAGGSVGVFVAGYKSQTLSALLSEITDKCDSYVRETFQELLGDKFQTNEQGQIVGVTATLEQTDTRNTVLDCTLSNYNADNALAAFGELVRNDTVGVALEKLYTGIKNLNDGTTKAGQAKDYSDDGAIKNTFDKIAKLTEETNGKYVAHIARDYSSDGGISRELGLKMNKSAFEFDGTNLTINL